MVKKKNTNSADHDSRSYQGVGIVFLVVGLGLLLAESTRVTGVPFLILGITFLVIRQEESATKPKKN